MALGHLLGQLDRAAQRCHHGTCDEPANGHAGHGRHQHQHQAQLRGVLAAAVGIVGHRLALRRNAGLELGEHLGRLAVHAAHGHVAY